MERSLEECLTFFILSAGRVFFKDHEIIERLNKEFKRRKKPMKIVAEEKACYTFLAFICLKMELTLGVKPYRESA
ncbi:MAG: hypothetical protein SWO11_20885 [Thermodesulfobacteriota bacterium]|nr:hypothetical protein [Thermodesulfobacteriota bacterium]